MNSITMKTHNALLTFYEIEHESIGVEVKKLNGNGVATTTYEYNMRNDSLRIDINRNSELVSSLKDIDAAYFADLYYLKCIVYNKDLVPEEVQDFVKKVASVLNAVVESYTKEWYVFRLPENMIVN
jgi:hypothetical protein